MSISLRHRKLGITANPLPLLKQRTIELKFGNSGGRFNETISKETLNFFQTNSGFEVKTTNINDEYDPAKEVANYVWEDVIVYHTPIWWFQFTHGFKKYIDVVFTEGTPKESTKAMDDLQKILKLTTVQVECYMEKNTC